MPLPQFFIEQDLVALAKHYRMRAKKSRAQAARDMDVAQTAIFHAEESPRRSLSKLRVRMIEAYSKRSIIGPVYFLVKKM